MKKEDTEMMLMILNLFSPVDRDDIIECPVCHNKIYGRAIAINNGFLVEKEDILQ